MKTRNKTLMSVCAWCPDKAARTAAAEAAGYDVTHGVCPACYRRQMRELLCGPRTLAEIAPEPPAPRARPERMRFVCRLRAELSPLRPAAVF